MLNIMKHAAEMLRVLRNHKYEIDEKGRIFMPAQKLLLGGVFVHSVNGRDIQVDPNLVVNEGLNDVLSVYFNEGSQTATWYVAPFSGNVTPGAAWTAASFASDATELTTQYDEATRQAYVEAAPASQNVTNSASPAVFTLNTSITVRGAGLLSTSAKGGTTGKLFAATRFAADRALVDDDVLRVIYSITASSV